MPPATHAPCGTARFPASLPVHRGLAERGVALSMRSDETADHYERRIETALMALFRDTRGEAEFAALYDYAAPRLYAWTSGLCQRFGGGDAQELLQDTFVNVYRYAASFKDEHAGSFQAWSRRIARNLARRRALAQPNASLQALPEGLQEPTDRGLDPLNDLVLGEERRTMLAAWTIVLAEYAAAWSHLASRDQLALELVEVRGLSYAAAARELGVRISNMKMIVFRARRRIRARLARRFQSVPDRVLGVAV